MSYQTRTGGKPVRIFYSVEYLILDVYFTLIGILCFVSSQQVWGCFSNIQRWKKKQSEISTHAGSKSNCSPEKQFSNFVCPYLRFLLAILRGLKKGLTAHISLSNFSPFLVPRIWSGMGMSYLYFILNLHVRYTCLKKDHKLALCS